MADANLTADRLRELLQYDPETGEFINLTTRNNNGALEGEIAGTESGPYIAIVIEGISHGAHRLAWLYMTGEWPEAMIDHKNRIKKDNRWNNLRQASQSLNMHNVVDPNSNNLSGYRGVSRRDSRFRAQITVMGKAKHLGVFDTAEEAHAAYVAAKAEHQPGLAL